MCIRDRHCIRVDVHNAGAVVGVRVWTAAARASAAASTAIAATADVAEMGCEGCVIVKFCSS